MWVQEGKLTVTLLFHLLKTQNSPNYVNNFGLQSLRQNIRYFETYYDSMKNPWIAFT